MIVLVARAVISWTYDVTLGCSSSMVGRLVMNQGSSLVWQMGGATLSIILLVHMLSKLVGQSSPPARL
jgi:hypothetical protein